MKRLLGVAVLLLSTSAFAATWNNVLLTDSMCAKKANDGHTKDCAMSCAGSGYGIVTDDGKFVKFDKKGNDEALKMLKASDKKDHLRVSVDGDQKGDTIAVKSIKWQ